MGEFTPPELEQAELERAKLKQKPTSSKLSRRRFLSLFGGVVATGAVSLLAGCAPKPPDGSPEKPAPTVPPASPGAAKPPEAAKATGIPPAPPEGPAQEKEPSSTPEQVKSQEVISAKEISATVAQIKGRADQDRLSIFLPARVTQETQDGKPPIVPKGVSARYEFRLEGTAGGNPDINNIAVSDLLGFPPGAFAIDRPVPALPEGGAPFRASGPIKGSELFQAMMKNWASPGQNPDRINPDASAGDILKKVEIQLVRYPNGALGMVLYLPNKQFGYLDSSGNQHMVNPAVDGLRFRIGRVSPDGKPIPPDANRGPLSSIKISGNVVPESGREEGVLFEPFTTTTPMIATSSAESKDAQLSQPAEVKTATGESPKTSPAEITNWNEKPWLPDTTVSLKTWWDYMVSKRLIIVYPAAESRVEEYLIGNLVPNPKDYRNRGYSFKGNCRKMLEEFDQKGYIAVDPKAYDQIPGKDDCQVYTTSK